MMTRSAIGDMVDPPKPPKLETTKEAKALGLTALKRLEFTNIQNIHKELAEHMMFLLRVLNTEKIKKAIIDDVKNEKIPPSEIEEILGTCLSRLILLEEEKELFLKFSNYVFEFLKHYQNLDNSKTNQGRKSPLYGTAKEKIQKHLSDKNVLPSNSELESAVKIHINPDEPDSVEYATRTAGKHLKIFKEEMGM